MAQIEQIEVNGVIYDITGTGGSDNIIEGYRNPTDGLFYEEQEYITAIEGDSNILYMDLVTVGDSKDIYRWSGTDFILENTKSKEIALNDFNQLSQAEKDNGTAYFIPDASITRGMMVVGNRFDKANIYSEDEKIVGSWMGKPLYQRTYSVQKSVPSAGNITIVTIEGAESFDYISVIDCEVIRSSDFNRYHIPNSGCNLFVRSNGDININTISGVAYNGTWILTVQYTKTNDGAIAIGTENDYSTDEMIIGTWIDGKPVYQRVVQVSVITGDGVWTNILNISSYNIETLVASYIKVNQNSTTSKGVFSPYTLIDSNNNLKVYGTYNATVTHVILKYTKTTD